ncbi:MAG: XamI family restriction endonuclease [Gammaproteobacteria bacterium]|nr:XamI family restriction endonuclease [Gammaproteobacteria bacterium]MDE0508848.1 XamI family restriction endonuclease [Gammaproteobacteria bacterium]
MAVNYHKPDRWNEDTARSVDMYNDWYMRFAPEAFRKTREQTTKDVQETFAATRNLTDVGVELLRTKPSVLPTLRMSTCPPLARDGEFPLLIEAKSAGDFTNVNKRRKEEATKMKQLRANYGERVRFILFLCGYFDSGYLGYEAAEGIDWVWEHRIDDFREFGL